MNLRALRSAAARVATAGALVASLVAGAVGITATPAGAAVTSLILTVSDPNPESGEWVAVTATANENTGSLYIDMFETDGTYHGSCQYEQSCTAWVSYDGPSTHNFIAFVSSDEDVNYPPHDVRATSNTVTVVWNGPPPQPEQPSTAYCPSPTVPLLEGSILGVYNKAVVQDHGTSVATCFRFEAAGFFRGGAIVVTHPTGRPDVDGNADACQTQHVRQTVLGQTVVVATGWDSMTGATWVCLKSGTSGFRVIVPTDATPDVDIHWDID